MNARTQRGGLAANVSAFAAVLLMVLGTMQAFAGLAAWASDGSKLYAATKDHSYFLHLSPTGWGWMHMILGVVIFCAGVGVASGLLWARIVGIVVAAFSAIANFGYIPIYPVWAIMLLALDILVIWALSTYRDRVA